MIELKNVSKRYGKLWANHNISCVIKQGEFVYLVGPSGAGKTTLLEMLSAQRSCDKGTIRIGNIEVEHLKNEQLYKLRRQLGIVSQKDLFLPKLTIRENLETCMSALELTKEQWNIRMTEVLTSVGMQLMLERLPQELSVGQQKKIAIARALLNHPPVILADEPTANLDVKSAKEIMQIFFRLNQAGTTVIVATHDSTMVNSLRHRTLELKAGRLIRDDLSGGYQKFSDPKNVYVW